MIVLEKHEAVLHALICISELNKNMQVCVFRGYAMIFFLILQIYLQVIEKTTN